MSTELRCWASRLKSAMVNRRAGSRSLEVGEKGDGRKVLASDARPQRPSPAAQLWVESAAAGQQWASSPRHIWCPGVWASFWHAASQQGFPLPSPDLPTLSVIPGTLWGRCLCWRKPRDKRTSVWILRFGAQSLTCPPLAALCFDWNLQDEGLGGSELKLPVL